MPGSLRLGKIAGFDVYLHGSWILGLALFTWFTDMGLPTLQLFPIESNATYLIISFVLTLLLFVCILMHEFAHALVARWKGVSVTYVVVTLFGGAAFIKEEDLNRPGLEFLVASAGPAVTFIIAILCLVVGVLLYATTGWRSLVGDSLAYLGFVNLLLCVFNLLPGLPLDGGRILRSFLWKITGDFNKATRITASVGMGLALLVILLSVSQYFTNGAGLVATSYSLAISILILIAAAARYIAAGQARGHQIDVQRAANKSGSFTTEGQRGIKVGCVVFSLAVLMIVGGSVLGLWQKHTVDVRNAQAVATAIVVAQQADTLFRTITQGPPDLYDSLSQPAWWIAGANTRSGGSCQFRNGALQVLQSKVKRNFLCSIKNFSFNNFAFQVQMTVRSGDCGGIVFRSDFISTSYYYHLYHFAVCSDGEYKLFKSTQDNAAHSNTLASGSSSAIHTGFNQPNMIAVVANGGTFDLYVNGHYIASGHDSSYYRGGTVALCAESDSYPTEVIFSNAQLWSLK